MDDYQGPRHARRTTPQKRQYQVGSLLAHVWLGHDYGAICHPQRPSRPRAFRCADFHEEMIRLQLELVDESGDPHIADPAPLDIVNAWRLEYQVDSLGGQPTDDTVTA